MAQHDYVIANGTGAAVRSDLNNALAAIVSQNSGATAPATTYAYQWWADTTTGLLKLRNGANNAWITLFQLDGEWSTLAVENGSAAAPSIYFKDSGTDTGFYSPGTDQVAISTGGTGRLFVSSTGLVGIGTSTIRGTSLLDARGDISFGSNATYYGLLSYNAGTGHIETTSGDGGFKWIRASGPATSMTLDSSGRLGVGTTSPGSLLHVAGEVRIGSSASYYARIDHDSASTGSNIYDHSDSGGHIFKNGGAERLRIDSSGRLLVGTSSDSGGALLQVNGDRIRIGTAKTPVSATDTGVAGEICWDASYIYVCTATNTWKRSAIATW